LGGDGRCGLGASRCHWSRIAAQARADAAAATAYQMMVTPLGVAGGSVKDPLMMRAYQASAMAAKLIGPSR
jgi:hypothetical protein